MDAVLSGIVRTVNGKIAVNVRLIEVETAKVWDATSAEGTESDLRTIAEEVIEQVA